MHDIGERNGNDLGDMGGGPWDMYGWVSRRVSLGHWGPCHTGLSRHTGNKTSHRGVLIRYVTAVVYHSTK